MEKKTHHLPPSLHANSRYEEEDQVAALGGQLMIPPFLGNTKLPRCGLATSLTELTESILLPLPADSEGEGDGIDRPLWLTKAFATSDAAPDPSAAPAILNGEIAGPLNGLCGGLV